MGSKLFNWLQLGDNKASWAVLAWLIIFPLLLVFALQGVVGMTESTGVYFFLLALFFAPLLWLNIFVLYWFIHAIRTKHKLLARVGALLGTIFLDFLSLGVFLFITFTVFGFGP